MMALIRVSMNKGYTLLLWFFGLGITYLIRQFFVDSNLTGIERRIQMRWIGIGVLYGGLMVYVIGGLIYKKWKKDADK